MTPIQKIKWAILNIEAEWEETDPPVANTNNIDDFYDNLEDGYCHGDAMCEFREGDVETEIPCDSSRYYESKSVAS